MAGFPIADLGAYVRCMSLAKMPTGGMPSERKSGQRSAETANLPLRSPVFHRKLPRGARRSWLKRQRGGARFLPLREVDFKPAGDNTMTATGEFTAAKGMKVIVKTTNVGGESFQARLAPLQ